MNFRTGRNVWTLCGWTPGLRRLLSGRVLNCGCLAGSYETMNRALVEVLDGVHPRCDAGHTLNEIVRVMHADAAAEPSFMIPENSSLYSVTKHINVTRSRDLKESQ